MSAQASAPARVPTPPLPLETLESVKDRIAKVQTRSRAFGKALMPFQIAGVIRAATAPGPVRHFGIFDEMGLGKTDQFCCIPRDGVPIMVGTPSVQKQAWARTMRLRRPDYRATIIERRIDWRFAMPGEIVIFNYELLPPSQKEKWAVVADLEHSVGMPRPQSIMTAPVPDQNVYIDRLCHAAMNVAPAKVRRLREILHLRAKVFSRPISPHTHLAWDEAQRAKSEEAKISAQVREVSAAAAFNGGNVYLLTATPQENNEDELWNVLEHAGLGRAVWGNKPAFMDSVASGEAAEGLKKVSILRRTDDVMPDLPPKRYEEIVVPLSEATKRMADDVLAALKAQGIDIEKATLAAIAHAMAKKIPRELISGLRKAIATAKYPFVLELVEDMEAQRVPWLVASLHRMPIDELAKRPNVVRISGAENPMQKDAAMQAFQDPNGKIVGCAISTKSAASGPTLTRAWRLIEVDIPWNPAVLDQLEGRIRRIGQKASSLLYTRIVADHVLERRVMEKLTEKREGIEANVTASAVKPGDAGWGWGDYDDAE